MFIYNQYKLELACFIETCSQSEEIINIFAIKLFTDFKLLKGYKDTYED